MILRSWLASLAGRFKASKSRFQGRNRSKRQSATPMMVESLEPRQLLAAMSLSYSGGNAADIYSVGSGGNNGTIGMNQEINVKAYPGSSPNPFGFQGTLATPAGAANASGFTDPPDTNPNGASAPNGSIVGYVTVTDTFTNGQATNNIQVNGGYGLGGGQFGDALALDRFAADDTFSGGPGFSQETMPIVIYNAYEFMAMVAYGQQQWSGGGQGSAVQPTISISLTAFDSAAPNANSVGGTFTINLTNNYSTIVAPVVPQYQSGYTNYIGLGGVDSGTQYYMNGGDTSMVANNTTSPVTNGPVPLGDIQPQGGPAPNNATAATPGDGVNVFNVAQAAVAGTVIGTVAAYNENQYQESVLTYSLQGNIPGQEPGVTGATGAAFTINSFTGAISVTPAGTAYLNTLVRSNNINTTYGNLGANPTTGLGTAAEDWYTGGYADVILAFQVRATNGAGVYSQTRDSAAVTTDTYVYVRLLDTGLVAPDVSQATTTLSVPETAPNSLSVGFFDVVANVPDSYISQAAGNIRIANTMANIETLAQTANPTGAAEFSTFAAAEPQQRLSYSIVGGNTPLPGNLQGPFAINPDTGEITINTANALEYSQINVYNLQIQVTTDNPDADKLRYYQTQGATAMQDVLPLSSVATLRINIQPEYLPVLIKGNSGPNAGVYATSAVDSFTIAEGSSNNSVVGSVKATDNDAIAPYGLGTLTYSIVPGTAVVVNGISYPAAQLFAIDPATGIITVQNTTSGGTALSNAQLFNYLNQQTIPLTVKVDDFIPGIPYVSTAATDSITVTLTKYDSTAPTVTNGSTTIPEHQNVGSVVAQVVATPGQPDFPIASYSIVSGNTATIGGTTYTPFSINALGQIVVNNSVALNYYLYPTFNLVIQVTDQGGLTGTGNFTVNLSYVPENIVMAAQTATIAEALPYGSANGVTATETDNGHSVTINQALPNGTVVYQMVATDAENPSGVANIKSFAINGGNFNNAFAIDQFGNVTVNNTAALNVDSNPKFVLSITVTENTIPALQTTANLTITLTAVHEPPIVASPAQTFTLVEHSQTGATVGTVAAYIHANIGSPLTYTKVAASDPNNAFSVNAATGVITVNDPHLIDFATTPTFSLQVMVTDSAATPLSTTATVTINLTNAGAGAPKLSQTQSVTIPEYAAVNSPVIAVTAPTGGVGPFSYSIIGGNTATVGGVLVNPFAINVNTGAITVNNSLALNWAVIQSFALKVQVVDGVSQSPALADTATVTVNLQFVDQPPLLINLETTPAVWTENINSIATVPVTSTVVATDAVDSYASTATVQITGNYQNGQDMLVFSPTANISGSWNAGTGTMTLSGVDTLTNYRAAIRSVLYEDISHNPNALTRTASFTITDVPASSGSGPFTSLTYTRNITVVPVNNPPILSSTQATLASGLGIMNYSEGSGAQPVNSGISAFDVDSPTLASATITLTNTVAGDVLGFIPTGSTGNIAVTSNVNNVLVLSSSGATATQAQWTAALQAVTFTSQTTIANPEDRLVTFVIKDGSASNNTSNTLSTLIFVSPVLPPTLSTRNVITYTEHNPATAIDPLITITNPSGAPLSTATITFTPGTYTSGQDVLGFSNDGVTMGNIAVQSNTGNSLTLFSAGNTATLAQWQSALEAVTYLNSSSNPVTDTRSVNFQVTNASVINSVSNQVLSIIAIATVNDPPVLTNPNPSAVTYTENSTPMPVIPSLIATDAKYNYFTGAVVAITGNYNASGQDALSFTNTTNIVGTWNSTTGTLTLTGTDTIANYLTALRSIAFYNTNDASTVPARTVSFTVTDNHSLVSNTVTQAINISTVNLPPVLSGIETSTLNILLGDPYQPIPPMTTALIVKDYDTGTMSKATVQISSGFVAAQERLGFAAPAGDTSLGGNWNSSTGTLTIFGTDTIANYQAALRSVSYIPLTSALPATLTRTITFQATDSFGLNSNTQTRNVNLLTTDTPAVVSVNTSTPLAFTQGNPATPIAPGLTVAPGASTNLQSAVVKITGNYQIAEDKLTFVTQGNITGTFNSSTATMTLSGTATVAQYQAALQTVSYIDTSSSPNTSTRTVSFSVNDGIAISNVSSRTIAVSPIDVPAVLNTNVTGPLTYHATNGAVALAPTLTLTDSATSTLVSATIQITFNYQPGNDVLSFANTAKITGVFNASSGTLTLSGADTISNYKAALQTVMYAFKNGTPNVISKTVNFSVSDGTLSSNTSSVNLNVSP